MTVHDPRGTGAGTGTDAGANRDRDAAATEAQPRRPSHRGRWIAIALIAVAAGAFGIVRGTRRANAPAEGHQAAGASAARGGGSDRPVPVVVARSTTRDVPINLEGLGTVAAFKTVSVHSQVEGRLMRVAFREGQTVRRGELLAEIDPRPFTIQLHQAQAALARDEAQLQGAQRNLERYAAVSAERLIPQQQTDDQRALVEQLRGTVQADRAQVENARLQLDYARITSPLEGVTGVRQIDPGNVVHVADPTSIVVVAQMDPIAVIFTLPQDDLPRVARQQAKAPLVVEALSRDGNQILATGALALIDNQINQATATMRLKAIFPNGDRVLWPNQFVKTRLRLDVRKGALVVPAVAIQRGPQGTFVYVAGGDNLAAQRPVAVDAIEGEQAILGRGLSPGERVVIEGQSQLRPGARITVRESGAGPGMDGEAGPKAGAGGGSGGRAGGRRRSVEPSAAGSTP